MDTRRERGRQNERTTAVKRTDAGQERGREREKGRREKIRVPPMSEMLRLLEKDTHIWDRWEVFTLKPEYQMPF